MKFIIEKDNILNCFIIWEVHNNYRIDRYHGKNKKECERWIIKNGQ